MRNKRPNAKPSLSKLHPRNVHQGRYDIDVLVKANSRLETYIIRNPVGEKTIDFGNDQAVVELNKALIKHYYHVGYWEIPEGFLCPPIPGRADYVHYLADLLARSHNKKIPTGVKVRVLDIGTGANLVYPIIGCASYGWTFVASEMNDASLAAAQLIVQKNESLTSRIKLVKQTDTKQIFKGVIQPSDHFSLTLCNPPFHSSAQEARAGTQRKNKNLAKSRTQRFVSANSKPSGKTAQLNFGGQHNELWCAGGELAFISQMIRESSEFQENVCWFSCLVSKSEHLKSIEKWLTVSGATEIEIIKMAQGQKISRFVAWTYLSKQKRSEWLLLG